MTPKSIVAALGAYGLATAALGSVISVLGPPLFVQEQRTYNEGYNEGVLQEQRSYNEGVLEEQRSYDEVVLQEQRTYDEVVLQEQRTYDLLEKSGAQVVKVRAGARADVLSLSPHVP